MAEGVGFEPTRKLTPPSGFKTGSVQPEAGCLTWAIRGWQCKRRCLIPRTRGAGLAGLVSGRPTDPRVGGHAVVFLDIGAVIIGREVSGDVNVSRPGCEVVAPVPGGFLGPY